MKIFLDSFAKFLGFLVAFIVFIIIINLLIIFIAKNKKDYFTVLQGDIKSENIVAVLKLGGPIIFEPVNFNNFDFFTSFNVIFPSMIQEYLEELEEKKVQALIVSIDSPGGSVAASEKVFKIISKFKEKNQIPVYFHTNEMLTSGAYWVSLSGDKIFASYGAIIGSIGVKGPDWIYFNSPTSLSSGILGTAIESPNGIEMYSNIAGKSKDLFNPFRKPTKNEELKLQKMVNEIYDDFITNVAAKRKIEKNILINEIGAMFFNSKAAKNNYLIDDDKDLDDVLKIITKKIKLQNIKVITNKKNDKYHLLEINNLLFNKKINYNILINKKICDNLLNGFSSISVIDYSINCSNP